MCTGWVHPVVVAVEVEEHARVWGKRLGGCCRCRPVDAKLIPLEGKSDNCIVYSSVHTITRAHNT